MDAKELITRRAAQFFHEGDIVNLGLGIPEQCAQYAPPGVTFHAEPGLLGFEGPSEGLEYSEHYFDAAGTPRKLAFGASVFDITTSFGIMRSGRLDATVLGALQVSETGDLCNWAAPGRVFGMGGAMDLAVGTKRVIVAMEHCSKDGQPKIVRECTFPLTCPHCVGEIVTELCYIQVTPDGLLLKELAPGVTVEEVCAKTGAPLRIAEDLKIMEL